MVSWFGQLAKVHCLLFLGSTPLWLSWLRRWFQAINTENWWLGTALAPSQIVLMIALTPRHPNPIWLSNIWLPRCFWSLGRVFKQTERTRLGPVEYDSLFLPWSRTYCAGIISQNCGLWSWRTISWEAASTSLGCFWTWTVFAWSHGTWLRNMEWHADFMVASTIPLLTLPGRDLRRKMTHS